MRNILASAIAVFLLALAVNAQAADDRDHDGLSDVFEAQLLEQFRPTFMVSSRDCDQLPSEMAPGEATPRSLARNGTIYGQATPHVPDGIELHYFHLWSRDCGRRGHAGDVEHVSALLRQGTDGTWKARYWYAAAHEGTACDRCMAARAGNLQADTHGPVVWISAGKHGSYFDKALCDGGCGGDSCEEMRPVPLSPIRNLGEPGAVLDGAAWATSPSWPFGGKLDPDFDASLVTQLEASPATGPFRVSSRTKGMQRTISVSNTTLGGLETGEEHTGSALETAASHTESALQRSYRSVKAWVRGHK